MILEKGPPGQLHVYLGTGNKIIDSIHKAIVEDQNQHHDTIYMWMHRKGIVGTNYRGGQLDGPNLAKVLRNVDELFQFLDPKFHCFVVCLKKFDVDLVKGAT